MEPWWTILLIVLGAFLALVGQFILEMYKAARRRDVLLMALEEELRAVAFDAPNQWFAGFTSQTFDELFADVALLLLDQREPSVLRRDSSCYGGHRRRSVCSAGHRFRSDVLSGDVLTIHQDGG